MKKPIKTKERKYKSFKVLDEVSSSRFFSRNLSKISYFLDFIVVSKSQKLVLSPKARKPYLEIFGIIIIFATLIHFTIEKT